MDVFTSKDIDKEEYLKTITISNRRIKSFDIVYEIIK